MDKQKEELIELADTINDTPVFISNNSNHTYTISQIMDNKIDKIEDNLYIHPFTNTNSNILNDLEKNKKLDNKILVQRENRRIISMIKKIISKKDSPNTTKLLIKTILIDNKKDITTLKDDKKNTLFHIYVEESDVSSLKLLLEVYIDILKISNNFYNFLFSKNIDDKNIFEISILKNDIPIIKLLYEQLEKDNNDYEKNKYMKYIQNNLFHIAVDNNQKFAIIFFYEKLKAFYSNNNNENILDSNEINKDKMVPIHFACKNKNIKLMNLLIDLGANINSQDKKGYTPLHYAVINNDERMLKHLLIRGANKFIKDENNLTPYNLSIFLGDKNLSKILYHKNCCEKQFCGEEIGDISKKRNLRYLLIFLILNIIIKISFILRFYFVINNPFLIYANIFLFIFEDSPFKNFNTQNNNQYTLNDFFSCIDNNCNLEVVFLFLSLAIDLLLFFNIIIFKCSKNVFLPKKNESEEKSLSLLFEKNENICVKCRIVINEKTQHCLICDRCVENWDHHCFWLNSCINDKNYKKFQLFILSSILFLSSNLLFYIMSEYFIIFSKNLFIEKIFKISYGSLAHIILITFIFCFLLYLIIIISYSLLFILIPIIIYICKKTKKNKKDSKKDVYKPNNNNIIDNEDEDDIINIKL